MASRFEVLFLVGLMTVVSAIAAAAADLFLFPALIAIAWRRREREMWSLETITEGFSDEHRSAKRAGVPVGVLAGRWLDPGDGPPPGSGTDR